MSRPEERSRKWSVAGRSENGRMASNFFIYTLRVRRLQSGCRDGMGEFPSDRCEIDRPAGTATGIPLAQRNRPIRSPAVKANTIPNKTRNDQRVRTERGSTTSNRLTPRARDVVAGRAWPVSRSEGASTESVRLGDSGGGFERGGDSIFGAASTTTWGSTGGIGFGDLGRVVVSARRLIGSIWIAGNATSDGEAELSGSGGASHGTTTGSIRLEEEDLEEGVVRGSVVSTDSGTISSAEHCGHETTAPAFDFETPRSFWQRKHRNRIGTLAVDMGELRFRREKVREFGEGLRRAEIDSGSCQRPRYSNVCCDLLATPDT